MDSVNSGSLQSSSGGDEESYDSRAESISAFLNNPSTTHHLGPMPNPPPQQPPPHHLHLHHQQAQNPSILFDPLSNYYDPLSSRSSPPLNLDMVWSKTLSRSDPNCTDLSAIMASPNPHPFSHQSQTRAAPGGATTYMGNNSTSPAVQFPPLPENAANDHQLTNNTSTTNTNASSSSAVRNSKKRSRASRRAPTTVLTTDTTNFRAMVQEFTGIPAPPFTSSSPFPRTRLDLFGTSSSTSTPPPYLLRPFAHKINQPFSSSSLMLDPPIASSSTTTTTTSTNNNNNNISTSINYQLPSSQNLLNMHNNNNNTSTPMLTFQSLLQSTHPPRYQLPNSSIGSKTHGSLEIPSNDSILKMGSGGGGVDFGLNQHQHHNHSHHHGHVSTNLIISGLSNNHHDDTPSWAAGGGGTTGSNGNFSNLQRVGTNGKLNHSASSSDFHGDKGSTENVSIRSEGMVESWICSSD